MPSDIILLAFLLGSLFYWFDSISAKEIATQNAKKACNKVSLEFLDETVAIKKLRLRRNSTGQMTFYREYEFEFSSTGEFRYKGNVRLLGKQLLDVEMEPYQLNSAEE